MRTADRFRILRVNSEYIHIRASLLKHCRMKNSNRQKMRGLELHLKAVVCCLKRAESGAQLTAALTLLSSRYMIKFIRLKMRKTALQLQ